MMKIKRWFMKLDIITILLIIAFFMGWVDSIQKDDIIKSYCTLFAIPIILYLIQNSMQKKQENNGFNIDVIIYKKLKKGIIWKQENENALSQHSYLEIVNTGTVEIFEIFIKVTGYDGAIYRGKIGENCLPEHSYVLKIPFSNEQVKDVSITCVVSFEYKTKKFWGCKSGNENKKIFAKFQTYNEDKHAIFYESGLDSFEKLERFWLIK